MTLKEYYLMFHELQLNLVAFEQLISCSEDVLRLVNHALEAERKAIIDLVAMHGGSAEVEAAIRARGKE